MSPLEQTATAIGILVALVTVAKAAVAVTRFFSDLSTNLVALTEAVKLLTNRIDLHSREFSEIRERVAALESWREDIS